MSERLVRFDAGSLIFRQGYPGEHAYIVRSGEVEIFKEHPDGSEERLEIMTDGQMFGELALLDDAPRSASARAHTDCVLQIMEI